MLLFFVADRLEALFDHMLALIDCTVTIAADHT